VQVSAIPTTDAAASAWAPLRHPLYRALWTAQFVSNVGTWMQTIGAQWLMGSLGGSALEVALVQAAATLPVFLVVLPAGALGDVVDRRRLLLVSQTVMLLAAAALAAVTFSGGITPWALLALIAAMGAGQGLTLPSWQAIVPEIVERREITLAAALAGVNNNLARAVGPAIGGLVVAVAGPGWTFTLNAVSFLLVLGVIGRWRRTPTERPLGPEQLGRAMRIGLTYARHAPRLRAVLVRATMFIVFAGALWALLPVLVRDDLGVGSTGYGLLLAAVGVGAVAGATALPRARSALSTDRLLTCAWLAFAAVCGVCALSPWTAPVAVAMVLAGAAWVTATSILNGTAIAVVPAWVSSRALALYTFVFQGGQAVSAIVWGVVAQSAGVRTALAAVGGGLVLGLPAARRWRLPEPGEDDVSPGPWPVPELKVEVEPTTGPVLVTVEYHVAPDRHDAFRERMRDVGRARRRTGAMLWGLFRDGEDPDRFVEAFLVATWEEHLRQHGERSTSGDRRAVEQAMELAREVRSPRVRHLFFAYED
jgi:MFS family permease